MWASRSKVRRSSYQCELYFTVFESKIGLVRLLQSRYISRAAPMRTGAPVAGGGTGARWALSLATFGIKTVKCSSHRCQNQLDVLQSAQVGPNGTWRCAAVCSQT